MTFHHAPSSDVNESKFICVKDELKIFGYVEDVFKHLVQSTLGFIQYTTYFLKQSCSSRNSTSHLAVTLDCTPIYFVRIESMLQSPLVTTNHLV